jgi:hypothetical protein
MHDHELHKESFEFQTEANLDYTLVLLQKSYKGISGDVAIA